MQQRVPEPKEESDLLAVLPCVTKSQAMYQETSNNNLVSGQPKAPFPMRLLLIVMGVIPLFLASIILDFRSVRSKLFNAPHVVSKHAFEYGNYTANNQLDAMIHVGMFKTGTTTLQMALGWSIYEELVSEGYYFLGKTGGTATMNKKDSFHALVKDVFTMFSDGKVKCLFPLAGDIEEHGECRMNQTRVQSFVGVLRHHYNLGHHLIVSWEGLSLLPEERLDLLGDVFRAAGYEPRIVVTSRYYHEWVPSWIQQHFRPAGYNPQLNKFEDAGATIPTIQQFLEDPLPYHTHCYFGLADCHYGWLANEDAPAANLRDRFQRFFNNVQIFQFNQEGDLVTNFVCQTLRYAKKTCRGLQDGTLLVPEHLQESIARSIMDYEYLAQAAYDKYYLLQYSEKRRAFVGMIQKHHQRKISSCKFSCSHAALRPFVLQCPTENEKRIFTNRSIAYERELFPDDFVLNDAGEDYESMLRNEAMYKMKGDKYCLINVHKTLEEPQWDVFFRYLEEGKDPYAEKRQPWSKVGFSDRHASPHSILKRSQH